MLQSLLRIIFYAVLFYLIYQLIRFFQAIYKATKPSPPKKTLPGIMVKDEICNTYIPKEDAIREVYQGREYFFCSKECQQKYLESKK